jgi:hypothetical protein
MAKAFLLHRRQPVLAEEEAKREKAQMRFGFWGQAGEIVSGSRFHKGK